MEVKVRYLPEFPPNPDFFTVHTNVLLTKKGYESYTPMHRRDYYKRNPPPDWVRQVLRIRGVKAVCIAPYHILVEKERLFDMKNIAPRSLKIFLSYFDPKGEARDLSEGMVQKMAMQPKRRAKVHLIQQRAQES